jgi:hypothetical protein
MATVDHDWIAVMVSQIVVVLEGDHAVLDAEFLKVVVFEGVVGFVSEGAAADGDVVQQAAGPTVGCVHRAEEAPTLRQQFAYSGGLHFGEVGSSVD